MVTSGVVQSTLYPSLATFKIGSETVKSGENYRYTTEDNWDAADNLGKQETAEELADRFIKEGAAYHTADADKGWASIKLNV